MIKRYQITGTQIAIKEIRDVGSHTLFTLIPLKIGWIHKTVSKNVTRGVKSILYELPVRHRVGSATSRGPNKPYNQMVGRVASSEVSDLFSMQNPDTVHSRLLSFPTVTEIRARNSTLSDNLFA